MPTDSRRIACQNAPQAVGVRRDWWWKKSFDRDDHKDSISTLHKRRHEHDSQPVIEIDTRSRNRIGALGLAAVGVAGVGVGLIMPEVSAPFVLLFGVAALIGAAGLIENRELQTGAYAVGAVLSLVAGIARLVHFGPFELLAVLLLALSAVFALRSFQYYRFTRATES